MAANRRDQIRMTDDEVAAFIESQRVVQVATINADGSPHLAAMWFAVVDGDIVFTTYSRAQKVVNLGRDARIACLLEDGDEYNELRGVQLNGRAELHDDPERLVSVGAAVVVRYQPDISAEQAPEIARSVTAKRTAVVVKADRVVSWDHRKLGGGY